MRNWFIAIKYFYRELTVYNLLFTLLSIQLLTGYGTISYIYIFWIKVMGYGFTTVFYYWTRKKHLYFFHNLQVNTTNLFVSAILIDAVLTLMILVIINMIIPE